MSELIIGAGLAFVKWIFGRLGNNAEKQKKIAELITKWMGVMAKEFLSSVKISKEYKEMWKKMDAEPWKETKP